MSMRAKYIAAELSAGARTMLDNAYWQPDSGRSRPEGWRIAPDGRGRKELERCRLVFGKGTYLTPLGVQVRDAVVDDLDSHPAVANG